MSGAAVHEPLAALLEGADAHTAILVLVRGVVQGGPYWAYASLYPSRYLAFKEAERHGGYRLEGFAKEILAHGPGEAPPAEVAAAMAERGCNPQFEQDFAEMLEQAAAALATASGP